MKIKLKGDPDDQKIYGVRLLKSEYLKAQKLNLDIPNLFRVSLRNAIQKIEQEKRGVRNEKRTNK